MHVSPLHARTASHAENAEPGTGNWGALCRRQVGSWTAELPAAAEQVHAEQVKRGCRVRRLACAMEAASNDGDGLIISSADREAIVADTHMLLSKLEEIAGQLETTRQANAAMTAEIAALQAKSATSVRAPITIAATPVVAAPARK